LGLRVKTFRRQGLVGIELPDEGMGFQKVQLGSRSSLAEQRAQIAQAPGAMMQGLLRGTFQCLDRMLLGEREQAAQDPHADGPALGDHRLGPTTRVGADQPSAIQQIIQTVLDHVSVRRMQVIGIGGELAGLSPRVDGDDFPTLIKDSDQARLPPRPYLAAHILWRHRMGTEEKEERAKAWFRNHESDTSEDDRKPSANVERFRRSHPFYSVAERAKGFHLATLRQVWRSEWFQ
jgi:hypothetical protein